VTNADPGVTTPWRRDPRAIEVDLTEWARSWRGADASVTDVSSPVSGMANDTFLFRLDGEDLVARLSPAPATPYPTFPTFDLEFQARVIDLVRRRTDVPAPEVVHVERCDKWLGTPFMVVRRVEGVVPSDNPPYLLDPNGWFLQGSPSQWKRMETSTLDVLVRLHRILDDGEDTAFMRSDAPGDTALARQFADVCNYYEWGRDGITIPILERAIEKLTATMPATERSVLNWGDARPGNIIYRDFEPVAALDWEMAAVGPPEIDVAWTTFFQRFFAGMAEQYGMPPVPDMFGRAETAATYARLGGEVLDDLAWYEALAGLRLGVVLLRMNQRAMAYGTQEMPTDPDDLIMFAPLLDQVLEEL
jgi:aminoglycoside phosphotransferase (APT) family kinase protein